MSDHVIQLGLLFTAGSVATTSLAFFLDKRRVEGAICALASLSFVVIGLASHGPCA